MTDVKNADVPAAVVPPAYEEKAQQPLQAPQASGVRQRHAEPSAVSAPADKKGFAGRATGAVAESAERQVRGVVGVATDAVSSGAWAYPIRGALYIVSREFAGKEIESGVRCRGPETAAKRSPGLLVAVMRVLQLTPDPTLIGPVLPLLLRALLISAGVVAACFFLLYLPQVAWLALFTGPLGMFSPKSKSKPLPKSQKSTLPKRGREPA